MHPANERQFYCVAPSLIGWAHTENDPCNCIAMDLLPDMYNCRLRMHRECQEHFPRHQLQRKLLVSDHGMHDARAVMHVGIASPRRRVEKTFPAFLAHAQLAILHIW